MNADQQTGMDVAKLKLLSEFFPIGKELRYSPDPELAVVLDTIVVAYCVDDHYLYSRNAIKTDSDGNPSGLLIEEEGTEVPISGVRRLHLLVPDTSDMEGTLDYDRRAIIGKSQQFRKDNTITLMANAGERGAATLIAHVIEQITLHEGPYTNNKMVLLNPDLNSISVTGQHHKTRGITHVPVELHFRKGEAAFPCMLSDFSESFVGLHASDQAHTMPAMEKDHAVTLVINLGGSGRVFTIRGRVLRSSADGCVIHLDDLLKGRDFSRFTLMDSLELKTGLLNYGQ